MKLLLHREYMTFEEFEGLYGPSFLLENTVLNIIEEQIIDDYYETVDEDHTNEEWDDAPVKKINGWVEFKVNDPINFVTLSPNVNKKEEEMYNAEQNARRHLTDRAHDVYGHKMDDIRVVTNVNGTQPKTLGELKEMLVAGNYTISGNDDQKLGKYTHAQDYIRLGPAFDEKKYDELTKQLQKDKKNLDDTIYVAAPADALKALQEFESKVYN